MNVLFMSLGTLYNLKDSSVHLDIMKRFAKEHNVWLVCKNEDKPTEYAEEEGIHVLRVHTGQLKRVGLIKKGIATVMVEPQFKRAIKEYLSDVVFDLVLYTTPPITFANAIEYVKKRDNAITYLMLKDIFPQNAVDLGILSNKGIKGLIYKRFRKKEKQLYHISDYIGCMSPANCRFVLDHNPEINDSIVEICPNATWVKDVSLTSDEKMAMREKYHIPLNKRVFVYGGNLGKPQGIPFLINCLGGMAQLEKAFFLIVGTGTEYNHLKDAINSINADNIVLLPHMPKDDYDRMIASCDIGLILLDHRFTIPNFPSRLLSYMQAGLPVLAATDPNTDIGKIVETAGFGWHCESDDIEGFIKTLMQVMSVDDVTLEKMQKVEISYLYKHYHVDRAYEAIMKHFE